MVRRVLAGLLFLVLATACGAGQDPTIRGPSPGATPVGPANLDRLEWRKMAPVPTPRTEVAAAESAGKIFVAGGFDKDGVTVSTLEIYDVSSDSWSKGPDLPIEVNHATAAAIGGLVYVFGGYTGPGLSVATDRGFFLRTNETGGAKWNEIAPMPDRRAAAGAALVGDKIFIAGGVGPGGLAESTLEYDPENNQWTKRPSVPTKREHLGVASDGERLVVVGGRTAGIGTNLSAAEMYNPADEKWTKLPDMPTARGGSAAGFAAGASGKWVVSAGGEAEATFDEAEALDVSSLQWFSLPKMPTARHGLAVVGHRSFIYVIAGGVTPGLSVSEANEAIDLSPLLP